METYTTLLNKRCLLIVKNKKNKKIKKLLKEKNISKFNTLKILKKSHIWWLRKIDSILYYKILFIMNF